MTKAETKKQRERMQAVSEACADEMSRFNNMVQHFERQGKKITLKTFSGLYRVVYVDRDFKITTVALDASPTSMFTQGWMLANDDRWAALLQQAGVERNRLFV